MDTPKVPEVPEQRTRKQLEENKGFGDMPEGEALPEERPFRKEPLGEVITDGARVKRMRDGNLGKIRRVMSDGRSWCQWDDGTESHERPADITVIN